MKVHGKNRTQQQLVVRMAQKTDTLCFVRLNFIKYWPIFKLFSLSESKEHLQ